MLFGRRTEKDVKTLYIDCGMGAAGDMLTAALLELVSDPESSLARLNSIGIPGVVFLAEKAVKCGITGTRMSVRVNGQEEGDEAFEGHHHHGHHHDDEHCHHHEHHHDDDHEHCCHHHDHHHDDKAEHVHRSSADVREIIDGLNATEGVKKDAKAIYDIIAEAESRVHGVPVTEIHFHEVGNLDAVADVTAVCMLLDEIGADRIYASPVTTGYGSVRCAHGILPVPAPATALILEGTPIVSGSIKGELTTPTGAAILKYFVEKYGEMPLMVPEKTGYGMGKKDFPRANCVRIILGESDTRPETPEEKGADAADCVSMQPNGSVIELTCNIDDMTAEEIGFAMEMLFDAGAIDVFTIPVGMKKMRPGTLLTALTPEDRRDDVLAALYKHTTTIGVRETVCVRYVMDRSFGTIGTPYGAVKYKESRGFGAARSKFEFEDLARIARETGMSLKEVRDMAGKLKKE